MNMKIGQALIEHGLLSPEQLDMVLTEQSMTGARLGDIVVKKGFIEADKLAPFIAKFFGLPFVVLKNNYKTIKPEVIEKVPEELALRFGIMPLDIKDSILTIAISDPLNVFAEDAIRVKTGFKIK